VETDPYRLSEFVRDPCAIAAGTASPGAIAREFELAPLVATPVARAVR
jgi:hypothetical protein